MLLSKHECHCKLLLGREAESTVPYLLFYQFMYWILGYFAGSTVNALVFEFAV